MGVYVFQIQHANYFSGRRLNSTIRIIQPQVVDAGSRTLYAISTRFREPIFMVVQIKLDHTNPNKKECQQCTILPILDSDYGIYVKERT